ncbi:hydrolase [Acinetobacter indicus]|uniref:alpha/beta hydrolase n=1 Tax=Acinetobacter TaxID=469 RepID=UPI0015D3B09C|nr:MULTISPECIES: hydrolase [Acinetobacter]MCP0916009.1 hydrolase [Acinetobacter indicus]MCP0919135.1 hydrolase [Acinetobacter indicus]MCP0921801.1 hydrolase [Acinetobacter indicus]QSQ93846.1 hydrolase [Acinetobacter indicus]
MSEQIFIPGPVGRIEVFVDYPQGEVKGFAVVSHPHPLQGGTPQHKVPALLAQMYLERDCVVYRPSFRGSGQSEGVHDEGFGETDDILEVIKYARSQHIGLPFYAGGFSFGAHVMAKSYAALPVELQPKQTILCGLPTATVAGVRHYVTPEIKGDILFIHGEADDVTLLSDMITWAKPQRHLVTILPGANHFFTGYLKQLRIAITRFLALG